jgi:hypothetical protein
MDIAIERIVHNNPTLGGADVITTTITRNDRTKRHYYIFRLHGDTIDSRTYIPIPFNLLTKTNGKGRFNHYIIIAVMHDGYVTIDLNKDHQIKMLDFGRYVGFDYDEAEEVVKFERPSSDDNNDSLPF